MISVMYGKCIIFVLFGLAGALNNYRLDNETYQDLLSNRNLNSFDIAKKYGYPLEKHHVYTEDGYLIEMLRVPYGVNNTNRFNRPAVLIGHGMGGTSAEYFMFGLRSIMFILAEAGFDMWVGNARGSTLSSTHKKYDIMSKQFWNFTWEQIGVYDYSAEIYYITNITGQEKIFFLGHSQGGSCYIAMLTERPEMNDKIRLGVLMGPSIYVKHNANPIIASLADHIEQFQGLLGYLHLYGLPHSPFINFLSRRLCASSLKILCVAVIYLIMGYDVQHVDDRLIPAFIGNFPGGLSFGQVVHFGQIFKAKRFQKYDYGPEENLKHYGSTIPPLYNLSHVTSPVVLMYGTTDGYMTPQDADDLCRDLPNCVINYFINETTYNHIAYLFGKDNDKFVINFLIKLFNEY